MGFPVITDKDRAWAVAQMPPWCQRGDLCGDEIVDDGAWLDDAEPKSGAFDKPNWSMFVAEEIEKFERHYAGQSRSSDEWSSMWRKGWWPKVTPRKRFPKSAPREPQPFFRKGTSEFNRAISLATTEEKRMWLRFGVAQFKPDDSRLKTIQVATA